MGTPTSSPPRMDISQPLLTWYEANRRELPWRSNPEPYRVWVSEIMLQQTRVETVIPYFERFLNRFPTPAALAEASEDEVLTLWSGLGYYRRARSLLEGAKPSSGTTRASSPGATRRPSIFQESAPIQRRRFSASPTGSPGPSWMGTSSG